MDFKGRAVCLVLYKGIPSTASYSNTVQSIFRNTSCNNTCMFSNWNFLYQKTDQSHLNPAAALFLQVYSIWMPCQELKRKIFHVLIATCIDCFPNLKCHPVAKWLKLIRWINRVLIEKSVQEGNRPLKPKKRCLFSENGAYVVTSHSHTQVYIYTLPQQDPHHNPKAFSSKPFNTFFLLTQWDWS